jgi:hypothetical protein
MVFTRPKNETLLRFVNINNVNNYKIQNRTNYLLISFSKDNKNIEYDYSIYNYIKDNKKPLILISKENDKKYTYLIKDENKIKCKYELNYNKKNYRYLFDITSNKMEDRKTYWNIEVKVNEISNFKLIIYQLMNWINYIININIKNYYFKKYIIMCYLLNLSL